MIRHIVMFNARNAADVPAIRDGLAVLGGISHARRFEVGLNTRRDALSSDVDVIVYAEFDDEAALAAYKADPLYAESIGRVRHLRDMRVVADYVVEDAVVVDRRG
ncbi:stress responsive protein [Tistrella bauzanensis]|uniref:Stress responsive protein n=1 Tax=Tistrella bauzanensis TaxID=657419 RepID=A0ABQ1IAD1_9PROT|nr:Dabb family protein [Tistrella bauzanensis]GGB29181.1 stress responsive protein [Tistrella bauzanensis]